MSSLYLPDDFDANGNFASTGCLPPPSFNEIDWNDPTLYTMPLTSDDIAAIMSDANNSLSDLLPPMSSTNNSLSDPLPPMSNTNNSLSDLVPPMSDDNNSLSDLLPPMPDPSSPQPSGTHSLSPDMSVPLREANSSSWAARNPTRSIIRPRTPPPRLTDAQKASRKIKRDQRVERTKRLHDAVAEYLDEQKTKIEALSRAHYVTPKQVNDIIG
ncbi:hypothetical protein P692DRAFT_201870095, partial [Suillus brevipes Sb2]